MMDIRDELLKYNQAFIENNCFIELLHASPSYNKIFHGWKLHLSIDPKDLQKAYSLMLPLLMNAYKSGTIRKFKMVDPNYPGELDERFKNGTQVTIYLGEDEDTPVDNTELEAVLQEITQILSANNIQVGKIPTSDAKTKYLYCSLRNSCDVDLNYSSYLAGKDVGKNFNPLQYPNPYESLLLSPVQNFSLKQHFSDFLIDTKDPYAVRYAFMLTLAAYLNHCCREEYSFDPFIDRFYFRKSQNMKIDLDYDLIFKKDYTSFLKPEIANDPSAINMFIKTNLLAKYFYSTLLKLDLFSKKIVAGQFYLLLDKCEFLRFHSANDELGQFLKYIDELHSFMEKTTAFEEDYDSETTLSSDDEAFSIETIDEFYNKNCYTEALRIINLIFQENTTLALDSEDNNETKLNSEQQEDVIECLKILLNMEDFRKIEHAESIFTQCLLEGKYGFSKDEDRYIAILRQFADAGNPYWQTYFWMLHSNSIVGAHKFSDIDRNKYLDENLSRHYLELASQSSNETISKFALEVLGSEIVRESENSELIQEHQTPEEILKNVRLNLAELRKAVNSKRRALDTNMDILENTDKRNIDELMILSDKIYETILDIMHYEAKNEYQEHEINDYEKALENFTTQAATYLAIPSSDEKSADSNQINQTFEQRMWKPKDETTNQDQTTTAFKVDVKKH